MQFLVLHDTLSKTLQNDVWYSHYKSHILEQDEAM